MMPVPRTKVPLGWRQMLKFAVDISTPGDAEKDLNDIAKFEEAYAAHMGPEFEALAFCRGRMALYHVLRNLDLKAGAEVIISAIHVADFVNAIRLASFTPVVVDLEANSLYLDLADLEGKITTRTGAVLVTHLAGYACDMDALVKMTKDRGIELIEDCSQAHGAAFGGKPLGSFSRISIFSLSLLKPICTIRGGVVVSRDKELMRRLRNQATSFTSVSRLGLFIETVRHIVLKTALSKWIFGLVVFPLLRISSPIGDHLAWFQRSNRTIKLRDSWPADFLGAFTGPQARLGLSQFDNLQSNTLKRRQAGELARQEIREIAPQCLPVIVENATCGYWQFPILVDDVSQARNILARHGIDSSPLLLSLMCNEIEFTRFGFKSKQAENTHARILFIPLNIYIDEESVAVEQRIAIRNSVENFKTS